MTTNKIPDDTEYSTAYQCYLHAFIGQFADPAKGQPWQEKLILEAATALGVRDGNASKMSGSPSSLPLNEREFRMAIDVMFVQAAAWTNNQIPCTEANLKSQVFRIEHKVPTEIRENASKIHRAGGTIYDLWLFEAEAIIATDLLRMAQPIYLDRIKNLAHLTRLKAIKTCELLFRANAIESDDLNDKRAAYFASLYVAELSSLPLRL